MNMLPHLTKVGRATGGVVYQSLGARNMSVEHINAKHKRDNIVCVMPQYSRERHSMMST